MNDDRQCTARSKQSGNRCKRAAIRGGTVCSIHGGKNPRVQAAARSREALREAQADAAAVLAHKGIQGVDDPILELSKLANEAIALKDALAARVNALSDVTYNAMGTEKARAELELFERALDRAGRMLEALGRHDLEARRVKVAEDQAALFRWVLTSLMLELTLTADQQEQALTVVDRLVRESMEGVERDQLPPAA